MWKTFRNIISGIKQVKKYGSLAIVVLDIIGYASEKLEAWINDNEPKEEIKSAIK
jgi:hypothetical protein